MEPNWQDLENELMLWQNANQTLSFWWRDDDAEKNTPALSKLLALSEAFQIPLALATIPLGADESLANAINVVNQRHTQPLITILQHGYSHKNYANKDQKKQELGNHRSSETIISELTLGKVKLSALFSDSFVNIQVPPWNRIDDSIIEKIAMNKQFDAISRHGVVDSPRVMKEINIHIDILNFKDKTCFLGTDKVISQILKHLQFRRKNNYRPEATGLMSHHLVHDNATWDFLQQFFALTQTFGNIVWIDSKTLLSNL